MIMGSEETVDSISVNDVAAFSALETEGKIYYNLIEIYNREVFDEHTCNA